MNEIQDTLIQRLCKKGLTTTEMLRVIKDVAHLAQDERGFTRKSIKQKLEGLGWQKHIMDQATLDLIVCVTEDRNQNTSQYSWLRKYSGWTGTKSDGREGNVN